MAKQKETKERVKITSSAVADETSQPGAGGASREPDPEVMEQDKTERGEPSEPADFESLYLRQATREFADDLDKLRNASDFTDQSVQILVDAFKQSAAMHSDEEKRKLMGEK